MKADLYIRVSTDEQAEKGYSQRDQEDRLRKYCIFKKIEIRDVIYEDYSAKTFKRPAWKKLLENLRAKRGHTNMVLFTKWDRFSRNAADAFQMINILRKLGVEPGAIEQPLDLDVPENKIMLGIYLTAPEVENDRRSLNVRYGLRRAVKEGRWMNGAPLGYINRSSPDGKKFIEIEQPYADIIKWSFETIVREKLHIVTVYKMAHEKGLPCTKNNFWNLIRNPVYCGKIFLKGYKEEPDCIVKGNHEPIISEKLYLDVQDILNGRKRVRKTNKQVPEVFILRGYLVCPKCGKNLTASTSSGRRLKHSYYHCNSACGTRFRCEVVNEQFSFGLQKLFPKPGMEQVFIEIIRDLYKKHSAENNKEILTLTNQVSVLQDRINKARTKFISGDIEKHEYEDFKQQCTDEINRHEVELLELSKKKLDIGDHISLAIRNITKMHNLFDFGECSERRKVVGIIFPEKIIYDGIRFRTSRINEAMRLVFHISSGFGEMGNSDDNEGYSSSGSRLTKKMTFSYLNSRTAFDENSNLVECNASEGLEQKKNGFLVENFEKSTSVA
jgi:site-specific DNA recombinase